MSEKTAKKAAGEAVRDGATEQTANQSTALTVSGDGDVSGPLSLALSQSAQDDVVRGLLESLHQVKEGFGELTKPGDIFMMDRPFYVIDAMTIADFVDQNTGEVKTKHIFKLEFNEGDVKMIMQSDARPRAILASVFSQARLLGERIAIGPYRMQKKEIPRQIQPAYIFVQQPGFFAGPSSQRPALTA